MAILCPEYNLLFLMAPRTGCTAIGDLLLERLGGRWLPEADILDENGHYVMSRKHNTLAQLLEHRLIDPQQRKSLFVFVGVRNPFDSLVTLYTKKATVCHDYAKDPNEYVHKMPRYLEDMQYCANHTFEQWIEHRFAVPAWRRLLGKGRRGLYVKYARDADAVMRFEQLPADFRRVLQQAGVTEPLELPEVNVTEARKQNYREYFSAESRSTVEYAFSEDIEKFSYRF